MAYTSTQTNKQTTVARPTQAHKQTNKQQWHGLHKHTNKQTNNSGTAYTSTQTNKQQWHGLHKHTNKVQRQQDQCLISNRTTGPPHQLRPTEVTNTRAQVPLVTPHNDYRLPLHVSKAAQNSFCCHHVTSERGVDLYHYTTSTQPLLPQGNTHWEGLTTQPPGDNTPPTTLTSDTHMRTQAPTTPSFGSGLHTKGPPSPLPRTSVAG